MMHRQLCISFIVLKGSQRWLVSQSDRVNGGLMTCMIFSVHRGSFGQLALESWRRQQQMRWIIVPGFTIVIPCFVLFCFTVSCMRFSPPFMCVWCTLSQTRLMMNSSGWMARWEGGGESESCDGIGGNMFTDLDCQDSEQQEEKRRHVFLG